MPAALSAAMGTARVLLQAVGLGMLVRWRGLCVVLWRHELLRLVSLGGLGAAVVLLLDQSAMGGMADRQATVAHHKQRSAAIA